MKFIINRFDGQKRYDQTYELNLDDIKGKTLLGVLQFIK